MTTYNIWPAEPTPASPSVPEGSPLTYGTRFKSSVAGTIDGVHWYRASGNTNAETLALYDNSGTLLASVTGPTGVSGWRRVNFASPVSILANTPYVVVSYSPDGYLPFQSGLFSSAIISGPLTAYANADLAPGNGLYRDGVGLSFPTSGGNSNGYYVDVIFSDSPAGPSIPVIMNQYRQRAN